VPQTRWVPVLAACRCTLAALGARPLRVHTWLRQQHALCCSVCFVTCAVARAGHCRRVPEHACPDIHCLSGVGRRTCFFIRVSALHACPQAVHRPPRLPEDASHAMQNLGHCCLPDVPPSCSRTTPAHSAQAASTQLTQAPGLLPLPCAALSTSPKASPFGTVSVGGRAHCSRAERVRQDWSIQLVCCKMCEK